MIRGNAAARWHARHRGRAKSVSEPWTAGVRPEAARLFGDEAEVDRFCRAAWRWFQRVDGALPFGVW